MAIDPLVSLAVTMQSNKGVYALLVGSGISKSAGIPTGWDVILDLIRRVAVARGEPCEPDPETWYREREGKPPSYSNLLNELTQTSHERMGLLRGYFEPTEEERESGQKLPTAAHKAIASLVAGGYVQVIVTTNFDNLLEQALRSTGVNPTVISTTAAVQGAVPLVHSSCTIVKVHGDYLDAELKNTEEELSKYHPALDALLDRIFEEYGLIVCGWSGEWDGALRTALERCSSHRYGTYWAALSAPSDPARKLIDLRRAAVLSIRGADHFFSDVSEKVRALDDGLMADPISPRVAVARLKRYLSTDQQIYASDLVREETERVAHSLLSERYSVQARGLEANQVITRLRSYEAELSVLLPLAICCTCWSKEAGHNILLSTLRRIGDEDVPLAGLVFLIALRRYPAHLFLYAVGIAAVATERYALLHQLLVTPIRTDSHRQPEPAVQALHTFKVINEQKGVLPGKERHHTPLSDHVHEVLREPLRELLPSDRQYNEAFEWFEYLLAVVYCSINTSADEARQIRDDQTGEQYIWCPIGRFSWSRANREGLEAQIRISDPGEVSPLAQKIIHSGLCRAPRGAGPDAEWLMTIQMGMDRFRRRIDGRFW